MTSGKPIAPLLLHLQGHPLVNGYILHCAGGSIRPEYIHLNGLVVRAEAEVEDEVILVPLSGSRGHLAGEGSTVRQGYAHLGSDGEQVDLFPVAEEAHLEPVMAFLAAVHEEPAGCHEIKIPVIIEVRPGRLVGGKQSVQLAPGGCIDKLEVTLVTEENRVILAAEGSHPVDSREEEIEIAIVVVIGGRWAGVGFLVEDSALAPALELEFALLAGIAQPEGLGLVAATVLVRKITGEEIKVPIVVKVPPGRTDGVASTEAGTICDYAKGTRYIRKGALSVVLPQDIRLKPVVGNIDVEVPVAVEVAGGHAAGTVADLAPGQREGFSSLVGQEEVGIGVVRPGFVAPGVEIDEPVPVEVAPAGPQRAALGQFGQFEGDKLLATLVVVNLASAPGVEVEKSVVIEIGCHAGSGGGHFHEFPALLVAVNLSADADIGPAVVVEVEPAGVVPTGKAELRALVLEDGGLEGEDEGRETQEPEGR